MEIDRISFNEPQNFSNLSSIAKPNWFGISREERDEWRKDFARENKRQNRTMLIGIGLMAAAITASTIVISKEMDKTSNNFNKPLTNF